MIYVQCEAASEGAALLSQHLREAGLPARRSRDVEWLFKRIKEGDTIIGWGEFIPFAGLRILNGKPMKSKWQEITTLAEAGVPVPPHDRTNWGKGWLGRSLHHQEGSDFLPPGERPPAGFYTRKLEITDEYRFHMFKKGDEYVSIRAGKKIPKVGEPHHEWIRSWNHGWYISYGKYDIPRKAREVAKRALKAVGYDFGAVDVGILKGGEPVVLEVNSRPGLEVGGKTVVKYVEAIKGVVDGAR